MSVSGPSDYPVLAAFRLPRRYPATIPIPTSSDQIESVVGSGTGGGGEGIARLMLSNWCGTEPNAD